MGNFDWGSISQFAYIGIFFIMMFYGQKIQQMQMLNTIKSKMKRLDSLRKEGFGDLMKAIGKYTTDTKTAEARLRKMLFSFAITPVNLDPAGIVPKMEHIFDTYDSYMKRVLKGLAPTATSAEIETLSNNLEVAMALEQIYRVVNHFYITSKKMGLIFVYQLYSILPMILEMAETYGKAGHDFPNNLPIGDGFGPMVSAKFAAKDITATAVEIERETSLYDTTFEGRRLLVVKARGPGGTVGRTGNAIEKLVRNEQTRPSLVVSIDAALKLEGMTTGETGEGVGVAMGGPGMDRFRIEQACSDFKIPLFCRTCFMSEREAITTMVKPVLDQVEHVVDEVADVIRQESKSGDTVIVVGVGNTMGVS